MRIIDRTLSCIDDRPNDRSSLLRFLHFLIKMNPGAIELSEKMYHLLSPLPEYPSYVLRLGNPADADKYPAEKYPHIQEFVCRGAPSDRKKMRAEILLNNTFKESAEIITRYAGYTNVRIQGLDCLMDEDYMRAFAHLRKSFDGGVEFCPRNHFNCATALALEWVSGSAANGADCAVVTSFGGLGGFAPSEELIMILREYRLHGDDKMYPFFPEMARLFHKITKKNISVNKPIIGSQIFHVESGVHVDGIIKQPKCYEPFEPEIVGQKRKIVLGKHSGTASILAKLSQFDLHRAQEKIPLILEQVKTKAAEKNNAVSDEEFLKIAMENQA